MREGDIVVTAIGVQFVLSKARWVGLPHEALAVFVRYQEAVDAAVMLVAGTRHQVFVNRTPTSRVYHALILPTRTPEAATELLPSPTCLSPE